MFSLSKIRGWAVLSAQVLLVAVGLSRMAGELLHVQPLEIFGMATAASPAPKVFSAVKGLETYSTQFYLEWFDQKRERQRLTITPEVYSRVRGPYNRRNVYGAALAYAPVLPEKFRDPVMRYALCGKKPLMRELGVDPSSIQGRVRLWLEPFPGTTLDPGLETLYEVSCR